MSIDNKIEFVEALTYQDVLLVPQYSDIVSRKEIDIGSSLDNRLRLDLPIISSPMDTISEYKMALTMAKNGGMAIIHRYNDPAKQAEHVRKAKALGAEIIGAAIGVTNG